MLRRNPFLTVFASFFILIYPGAGGAIRRTMRAPCEPGYFPCNQSDTCVEQRLNCDGYQDCPDGSDEWHCVDSPQKDYWNLKFKKRPDEDREKKMNGKCDLSEVPPVCRCSERSLYCEHSGLHSVPDSLPYDALELDLSSNDLPDLNTSSFPEGILQQLILHATGIKTLGEDTFANFKFLETLYLAGNEITHIRSKTFASNSNLRLLILSHNLIRHLDANAFYGLNHLVELDLRDCELSTFPEGVFNPLTSLNILWLDGNNIEDIPPMIFQKLHNLETLSLSRNRLKHFIYSNWIGLSNLKSLSLASNRISHLDGSSFGNLSSLLNLDLRGNGLRHIWDATFDHMSSLQSLDLRANAFRTLGKDVFSSLTSLTHIYFDDFHRCSYVLHVRVCEPRGDGISSFAHLLDNLVLRVSVWVVAFVACFGNLFVLIGRMLIHETNEVHSFFIKNLALADFLMGLYLFIIAAYDVTFRGEYIRHEQQWRLSWQCNLCGFLSTVSSEASVLILTVITVDRYLSVVYPLSLKRRTMTFACLCMLAVWAFGILLAALPLLDIDYYGREFYGNNGVCLPLHIHDPYGQAWAYSTFMFCGLNLAAFVFITYAYISMSITIASSRMGLRSTQQQQDRTIAKRFGFIVGTDCLCWMPVVFIKFLAMAGVPINDDLYAWVAVFLLPVNSALNPVLYTLATKIFKQHLAKIAYSLHARTPPIMDNSGTSFSSLLPRGSKRSMVVTLSENDPPLSRTMSNGTKPSTGAPLLKKNSCGKISLSSHASLHRGDSRDSANNFL